MSRCHAGGKKKPKGLWVLLKDNRGSWNPDWGFPETWYLVKADAAKLGKILCGPVKVQYAVE